MTKLIFKSDRLNSNEIMRVVVMTEGGITIPTSKFHRRPCIAQTMLDNWRKSHPFDNASLQLERL